MTDNHETWMRAALVEARKAYQKGEVPVGAVVVHDNNIIGKGHNLVESIQDPSAHAEMLAITTAANTLASWRLGNSTLYVTLEPCMMCAGAILLSRVSTVVFGAYDPRYGACGSKLQIAQNEALDIQADIIGGVLQDECSTLIKDFFRELRQPSA
jgi:tRNA(adenine34) deaminase